MNSRARVSFVGLLVLVGLLPSVAHGQGFNLGMRLDFAAGVQTTSVAVGDLNNDGKLDLVSANANSGTVSFWLGDGAGGYGARTDLVTATTSSNTSAVAIADMNGDGKADLIVVSSNQDSIVVLLGSGLGGFLPRITYSLGGYAYPVGIAIADLNNDGKPDVVTTDQVTNTVIVLLGNGASGLGVASRFNAGSGPTDVVVADVNNDAKPDLLVSDFSSNKISVLLGDNSGAFFSRVEYATNGTGAYWLSVGDVTGEGNLDVVVANYTSNSVSVMINNGAGAFFGVNTYPAGSTPFAATIGDVNGDGKPDIAVAGFGNSVISVLIGDGTGSFGGKTDFATGFNPADVQIADVNGDGRADIVAAVRNAGLVSVLFGNGPGLFTAKNDVATGSHPEGVAIGDVNGDGKGDVAIANTSSNTASVMLGDGLGGFTSKFDVAGLSGPTGVALRDMNGDGLLDLVVANFSSNTVQVCAGNGAGGFTSLTPSTTGAGPNGIAVGDLNGDGKPDVAVANFQATTVSVFFNNGAGSLGAKTDITTGTNPAAVAMADVNGDGRLDLIVLNFGSNTGSVLINNGGGTFAPKVDFSAPAGPAGLAVGDMNADGWPDIAVVGETANTAWVLWGNGTSTYNTFNTIPTGTTPTGIAMADINGDGRLDLVIANYGANTMSLVLGNGSGFPAYKTDVAVGTNPQAVAAGDLNGDGRPDVALANYGSNTASVLLALERTRTTLAASPLTAVLNAQVILTANVSVTAPGSGAPTGTVSFFDGKTLLGTTAVNNGVAGLSLFTPRLGFRSLGAVYNGDGKLLGSYAPPVSQTVVSTAQPRITLVHDVLNDQGRVVRTRFRASPLDVAGSSSPIVRYDVFRQVNPALGASTARPAVDLASGRLTPGPARALVDGWDYVGSTSAFTDSAYDVIVPTVADSNGSGLHRSVFFVRAVTATPSVFYDSPADSGYSVDNLPPVAPAPFTAAYAAGATHLHWGPNAESDLWYYRVYRGTSSGFVPGPANLVVTPSDTGYADPGAAGSYYKLSAVDRNGNEGPYAALGPNNTTDVGDDGPLAFALEPVHPNPARGGHVTIQFTLPSDGPAKLEMLDVSGRRVAAREVGSLGPGRHAVDLNSDRALTPGMYLVRLTHGTSARVTRVAIVD